MAVSERSMGGISPHKAPVLKHVFDTALNDADKTFTVPAKKIWRPLHLYAVLIATATVGNRQIKIDVRDDADVVIYSESGGIQAESLTHTYRFNFGGAPRERAVASGTLQFIEMPEMWLPSGFDIRIFDSISVDLAADDLDLQMMVMEYEQAR